MVRPFRDRLIAASNGAPAFYPSGQLAFANGVIYDVAKGLVDWIRDANGNTVAFQRISSGTNSGEIQQITDPLGRTISISYGQTCTASLPGGGGSVPSTDTCDFISYTGYQGAARTIQIANTNFTNILRSGYTAETESTLFVNSAFLNSVPTIEAPAAVTLPEQPRLSISVQFVCRPGSSNASNGRSI